MLHIMIDPAIDLDDVVAAEYFKQYENIVRGKSSERCIQKFTCVWRTSAMSAGHYGQKHLEMLVKGLEDAVVDLSCVRKSFREQIGTLRVRPLIYCFISCLVCVLLLHYA